MYIIVCFDYNTTSFYISHKKLPQVFLVLQLIITYVSRSCDKWTLFPTPPSEYRSTRAQFCLCFLKRWESKGSQCDLVLGCATAVPFKVTAPGGIFRLAADQVFSLVALKETLPADIHLNLLSVNKLLLF